MSVATQQTGRYRMRFCAACGSIFTFDAQNAHREQRTLCRKCRKERLASRATGVSPSVTVENHGTIPGGNIHTVRPMTVSPLNRIYYP